MVEAIGFRDGQWFDRSAPACLPGILFNGVRALFRSYSGSRYLSYRAEAFSLTVLIKVDTSAQHASRRDARPLPRPNLFSDQPTGARFQSAASSLGILIEFLLDLLHAVARALVVGNKGGEPGSVLDKGVGVRQVVPELLYSVDAGLEFCRHGAQ